MITESTRSHDQILGFEFTGKLDPADYNDLIPDVERTIAAYGKVRLLVRFHEFSGWTPSGFWEDIRFSARHRDSIERFAVVGETAWQKVIIELGKPLVRAEVKYFPETEKDQAWAWLEAE